MLEEIKSRVIQENINIHHIQAEYYDLLHSELNNSYIIRRLDRDIDEVLSSIKESSLRVLDLGTGTGYLAIPFLKKGCYVHSVDLSEEMLKKCQEKIEKLGLANHQLKFSIAEIEDFLAEFNAEKFHIIAMSSLLHHLHDYMHILDLLDKHLCNGGILFIAWEPTSSKRYAHFSFRAKILDFIDSKLFKFYLRRIKRLNLSDADYTYSDYQISFNQGCDPDKIINVFTNRGYTLLKFKIFSGVGKSAFTAWLHNFLNLSSDHFRIIFKK